MSQTDPSCPFKETLFDPNTDPATFVDCQTECTGSYTWPTSMYGDLVLEFEQRCPREREVKVEIVLRHIFDSPASDAPSEPRD